MIDSNYLMYCFAHCVNPEYSFIERYDNDVIKIFKTQTSKNNKGIVLPKDYFNPVIFENIPINRRCSIKQVLKGYKLGTGQRLDHVSVAMQLVYPYNLIYEVAADLIEEPSQFFWYEMTEDRWKGLDHVLSKLTQREQDVIDLYYNREESGLTYDAIAKQYGVTRERIRQILMKALRKLRAPYRLNYILYGYEIASGSIRQKERALRQAEIDKVNKEIDREIAKLKETLKTDNYYKNITLIELDLSVRSYNCLTRAGINNLFELSKLTESDIFRIRNIGYKSFLEIIDKLKEYGITLEAGEYI